MFFSFFVFFEYLCFYRHIKTRKNEVSFISYSLSSLLVLKHRFSEYREEKPYGFFRFYYTIKRVFLQVFFLFLKLLYSFKEAILKGKIFRRDKAIIFAFLRIIIAGRKLWRLAKTAAKKRTATAYSYAPRAERFYAPTARVRCRTSARIAIRLWILPTFNRNEKRTTAAKIRGGRSLTGENPDLFYFRLPIKRRSPLKFRLFRRYFYRNRL